MSKLKSKCHGVKTIEGFCPYTKEKIYFCSKCKQPVEIEERRKK